MSSLHPDRWWWLSTHYGTGGVRTVDGMIVEGAPIFKSLFGQDLDTVVQKGGYKALPLGSSGYNV